MAENISITTKKFKSALKRQKNLKRKKNAKNASKKYAVRIVCTSDSFVSWKAKHPRSVRNKSYYSYNSLMVTTIIDLGLMTSGM